MSNMRCAREGCEGHESRVKLKSKLADAQARIKELEAHIKKAHRIVMESSGSTEVDTLAVEWVREIEDIVLGTNRR